MLLLALLLGCPEPVLPDPPTDGDGDGFDAVAHGGDDCDDADDRVHPDAVEACNDRDDDCDGVVDPPEVQRTFYADADADGYGAATPVLACDRPEGTVAISGDCDDANHAIHPDAVEVCNDADDDCDGGVDLFAVDGETWFADADLDGYGDPASPIVDCTGDAPAGAVATGTDCNDFAPGVHPDALDDCDGTDTDCDGTTDEDGVWWYADADGDGFGDPGDAEQRCDTPADRVMDDTDCDDTAVDVHPGAAETCAIPGDDDCNGLVDDAPTDGATFYVDADGDGFGSTAETPACSLPFGHANNSEDCDDDFAGSNPGTAEICNDGHDNDCDGGGEDCVFDQVLDVSTAAFAGRNNSSYVGMDLAAGDFDGDGDIDLVSGSYGEDTIFLDGGRLYVWDGPLADPLPAPDRIIDPAAAQLTVGVRTRSVGDMDGDGTDDLLVSSYIADVTSANDGAAWLFHGPLVDGTTTDDATLTVHGLEDNEYIGWRQITADTDKDGDPDLVFSTWRPNGSAGAAYIFDGETQGVHHASGGIPMVGAHAAAYLGYALASGDFDGDGFDDLAISAAFSDLIHPNGGLVGLYTEAISAQVGIADADTLLIGTELEGIGWALAADDFDGDGSIDLMASSVKHSEAGPAAGAALLFSNPGAGGGPAEDLAVAKLLGPDDGTEVSFGYNADFVGDTNGDGLPDIMVAHTVYQPPGGGAGAGANYLFTSPFEGSVSSDGPGVSRLVGVEGETGRGFTGVGDLDGDGLGDLAIGGPFVDNPDAPGLNHGAVWLVHGIGL